LALIYIEEKIWAFLHEMIIVWEKLGEIKDFVLPLEFVSPTIPRVFSEPIHTFFTG
jgi:hypothetical protein